MTGDHPAERIVLGVGAVIWNERGEVLLIRRLNPPRQNEWSLPGGRVEFGESLREAVVREVREETSLDIEVLAFIDVAELIDDAPAGADGTHYVLVDFCARVLAGKLAAASDAADARWFSTPEIDALPLWSETRRIIALGRTIARGATEPRS